MSMKSPLLTTGIVGAAVTAICCVTPLLVVLFGLLGISAWLGWIDLILLPLLGLFIALTVYALVSAKRNRNRE
jgi:mercuric ion transport protein